MKINVVIVVATLLLVACACQPTTTAIAKPIAKRRAQFVDDTTPPCSLSIYRYLFNKPGTKIRPNLPAGTVIFGKALPGPENNAIGDTFAESGSKIDATEIKPDEGNVPSASEPQIGYLPPDNNYLPPPPNPSIKDNLFRPSKPGKPNYFLPIGSVDVTPAPKLVQHDSSTVVVVSSTPAPASGGGGGGGGDKLSSTLPPDVIASSTIHPEIPISSATEPHLLPLFSTSAADLASPSPTPSPGEYPIFGLPPSPALSPEYPPHSLSFHPAFSRPFSTTLPDQVGLYSSHCNYPRIIDGTRCICENGKVFFTPTQNYPLHPFDVPTNQPINGIITAPAGPGLQLISSPPIQPVTSSKPFAVEPQLNENSIEYSFPTPKPFIPLISSYSTPVSKLPAAYKFSHPPAPPPVLPSSTTIPLQQQPVTIISSTPKPEFNVASESGRPFPEFPLPSPSPPAFQPPKVYPSYQAALLANFPPHSSPPSFINPLLQQPQPILPSVFRYPSSSSVSAYQYPSPSIPFVQQPSSTPAPQSPLPPSLPSDGYQYPKPSIRFPLPSVSSTTPSPPPPIYIAHRLANVPPSPPSIIRIPVPLPSTLAPPSPLPSSVRIANYQPPPPPPPPPSSGYQYPKPSISFPLSPTTSASPSPTSSIVRIPNYPSPSPPISDYQYAVPYVPSTPSHSSSPATVNEYQYPKPSVPFPPPTVQENQGYSYPKPQIPFDLPNVK